jgi:hypothetical protein
MKLKSKRTLVLIGVLAVAAFAAFGAYAYWTTSGSGAGTAATGTDAGVSVSQLGSVSNLVPGGPDQSIDFRISNGATFNQYITSVTVAVAEANGATWDDVAGCSAADFAVTQPTWTPADLSPGDHDYVGVASGAQIHMVNAASNQDACKSVTVPLWFSAN